MEPNESFGESGEPREAPNRAPRGKPTGEHHRFQDDEFQNKVL